MKPNTKRIPEIAEIEDMVEHIAKIVVAAHNEADRRPSCLNEYKKEAMTYLLQQFENTVRKRRNEINNGIAGRE